uniref:CCHC-type domain-containing protein n=1 Tax=Fagus sylvatica TaxID=28930 RepID=A0A2N9J3P2_FAGSY
MASSNANSQQIPFTQSPLLLLSNMSNLMSIKLDSINYIVWKLQLTVILDAYSMKDHIDGLVTRPSQFLLDAVGSPTLEINQAFKAWQLRDKALLTLTYSTLTPSILPMVVGLDSAQEFGGNGQSNFVNYNRGRGGRNNHRGRDSSRPQCQICGKLGHLAIDCYQRMNFAYQDKNPPSKLAAMAATNNPSQVEEMWLTDTGATDHITANTNNFTTQASFTMVSDQVVVGNGQNLPINTIDTTPTVSHPLHNPEPHSNPNSITNTNPSLTDHPILDTDPASALTTLAVIPATSESCVLAIAPLAASHIHSLNDNSCKEWPLVKPPTVRHVLSLTVSLNWPLRQLDVRNAFLHGTLQEEVYMAQPPGYVHPQLPYHVCRLHKSLYGLKQAPRAWFESFTGQLLHLGFNASSADSFLFIFQDKQVTTYLLLYVDDIVLTSNTPAYLDQLIKSLSSMFELKDLGPLSYFLGLQVTRTFQGLYLSQTKYAIDLLTKHNMFDTKPAKTPCCPNTRLTLTDGTPLQEPHSYKSLVGALHYLTFTRPDLSFAVHQVCQFMHSPTTTHLTAAKQSEYRALAIAAVELCWLRTLLRDLGVYLPDTPILWCDNVSALAIASNPVFHAPTKHIEVDFHFVREQVLRKDLAVKFVSTTDQLANIFTKSLPTTCFLDLQRNLLVPVCPHVIEGG